MGKNYKIILICEKCGKKHSDKWEARRCCEPVVIKKTSQKIPHRSFRLKLCGNIKPKTIKEALMLLGTSYVSVLGYYKFAWNYDFYVEMEVK